MNNLELFKTKVQFVRDKFPNIHRVNPFMDIQTVRAVKDALYDAGFTKVDPYVTPDSVAINLILAAKGTQTKRAYRSSQGRVYDRKHSGGGRKNA